MQIQICYDPLTNKKPVGVISRGKAVRFEVITDDENIEQILFMVKEDAEFDYAYIPMKKTQKGYEIKLNFDNFGHFWYNFKVFFNNYVKFLSKTYDTRSVLLDEKGEDFLQLVTENEYTTQNAIAGGVIYQIMVDRFNRIGNPVVREPLILRNDWGGKIQKNSNNPLVINLETFGGNFKGVEEKLDYLHNLGVTVIYFNPICLANSNHKYDTANYMQVDSMFGSEEDFKILIEKAKSLGIKIIIDGVYNHTGSDSIYFNKYNRFDSVGAYNSQDSKYYSWYDFINYPDEYQTWWGIDTLPKIRSDADGFHNLIAGDGGVIEKFLKLGVFGLRLDVVDELTDKFTKQISDKVKSMPGEHIVVGEVWEDASTKIAYSSRKKYFTQNELSSVMNYPIKETIINYIRTKNSFDLECTIRMLKNNYPKAVQDNLMNFLGTHDTGRIFSELLAISNGDKALATKLLKIATTLLFTMVGVPSIFYGDEYGIENNDGSSRGCYDWNNNKNEISDWYKKLCKLRNQKVFAHGDINVLMSNEGKFVFERFDDSGHIVVAVNLKDDELVVNLNGNFVSYLTGKTEKKVILKCLDFDIFIEK